MFWNEKEKKSFLVVKTRTKVAIKFEFKLKACFSTNSQQYLGHKLYIGLFMNFVERWNVLNSNFEKICNRLRIALNRTELIQKIFII